MKKFIKNNIKLIVGVIIGAVISGFTVYGATIVFSSGEVGFDNTNANLTLNNVAVDNVQDAIDAIYTKVTGIQTQLNTCTGDLSTAQTNYSTCSSSLSTAQSNYSTCSSSLSTCQSNLTTAQANEFLTKYKTMSGTPQYYAWNATPTSSTSKGSHNVYLAKWSDEQLGVCIYTGGTEYCFRYNNYFGEKEHVQEVFGASHCYVPSSMVLCNAFGFDCYVYSNGRVDCTGGSPKENCSVGGDGSLGCY